MGDLPQSLILGRVHRLHLDDSVAEHDDKGRLRVDARRLDPLGRLGPDQYLVGGEVIRVKRPA